MDGWFTCTVKHTTNSTMMMMMMSADLVITVIIIVARRPPTTSSNLASVSVSSRMWLNEVACYSCLASILRHYQSSDQSDARRRLRTLRWRIDDDLNFINGWQACTLDFFPVENVFPTLRICVPLTVTHTHRWSLLYIPACLRPNNRQAYRKIIT